MDYTDGTALKSSMLAGIARKKRKHLQITDKEKKHLEKRYTSLKELHEHQQNKVRNCMHDVMSPLSAVSGYLELMNMNLNKGVDTEKIKKYSSKISDGLQEISELLEQLQELYSVDDSNNKADIAGINLNLLAEEVASIIQSSASTRASAIECRKSFHPVFVQTDLFQLKLVIYNLIYCIDEFATDSTVIVIQADSINKEAVITIRCEGKINVNHNMLNILSTFKRNSAAPPFDKSTIASGVIMSSKLADQINGEIHFFSENDENPRFLFTLPTG